MEKEMGVDSTVMDGESALKFGLMEVVHEWANGMVRTSSYSLKRGACIIHVYGIQRPQEKNTETSCWHPLQCTPTSLVHLDV